MELPTEPSQDAQGLTAHAFSPSSSPELASSIVCGGCGSVIDASEPYPFRCPRSGDDGDHVLRRVLDVSRLAFPLTGCRPQSVCRIRWFFGGKEIILTNRKKLVAGANRSAGASRSYLVRGAWP